MPQVENNSVRDGLPLYLPYEGGVVHGLGVVKESDKEFFNWMFITSKGTAYFNGIGTTHGNLNLQKIDEGFLTGQKQNR